MIAVTLMTDGASDRCLLPIVEWSLRDAGIAADLDLQWADLRHLRAQPTTLEARIRTSVDLYPCELLIIHRDAEKQFPEERLAEIGNASSLVESLPPYVPLVTVRMQEAWLLIDEAAIRLAAGNPNGSMRLSLPPINKVELLPNPKDLLFSLIREASGLSNRRRQNLNVWECRLLIPQFFRDFAPLRELKAFLHFQEELERVVTSHRFNTRLD